jgi:hypothetical protein
MNATIAVTTNNVLATCITDTCLQEACTCDLCQRTVLARTTAFVYRFFDDAPEISRVSHSACFKASSLFRSYSDLFVPNRHLPADFATRPHGFDMAYHALLLNFDFRSALQRLAYPGSLSSSGGQPSTSAPMTLIDILLKCGYRKRLLDEMRNLPPHVWILLALHDDPSFQAEAARLFNEPALAAALDALRCGALTADDIASLTIMGWRNKKLLSAVAEAIARFGLDETGAMRSPGFSGFAQARYMQLIFLCASTPTELPALSCYLRTGEFGAESDQRYARSLRFYHRAALFHIAMFQPEDLHEWLNVSYEWLGAAAANSCSRYIAASCDMVTDLMAMQPA